MSSRCSSEGALTYAALSLYLELSIPVFAKPENPSQWPASKEDSVSVLFSLL